MAQKRKKNSRNRRQKRGMIGNMSVAGLVISLILMIVICIMMAFITLLSFALNPHFAPLHLLDLFGLGLSIYGIVCCALEVNRRQKDKLLAAQPEPEPEPAKPEVQLPEQIPEPYERYLVVLKKTLDSYEERDDEFDQLLEDCFGGSNIAKARYSTVIDQARRLLKENYERAEQAVELFRFSAVTKERCSILQQYVDDSNEVAINIERVINELAKNRHHSTNETHDALNDSLRELASTTSRYSSNH